MKTKTRQNKTLLKPIYMRVGHVFDSRFSPGKILPISKSFGIFNKEWLTFKKMLLIFL